MSKSNKDNLIASLQAEIEALRTVISMTPGNVYWKDLDGSYLGCNKNVADVLQLNKPEEILGKTDEDLIGEEFALRARKIDLEVLTKKKEKCIEESGFDAKGNPVIYLTRKTPIFDKKNDVIGILGISFDITDRKQMEEKLKIAKQKAETATITKSNFLATISHELRTPLTSILGFANLLEQTNLTEDKRLQFTTHISDSGNYLLSLINSLLEYNKLETNNYELEYTYVNLKEVIESILDMLNVTAGFKKLPLELYYDNSLPKFVFSNHRILRQIFINLIGNAIKFTEKGFVKVYVKKISETEDNVKMEISVEDTGIGISTKDQRNIFKRFTQLENIYTRNNSLTGTGLGLAIVKKLVKLLGGKIRVSSEINKGSTFFINCDFKKAEVSYADATIIETNSSVSKPFSILLIEDNPLIQIIHKNMLEDLGCKVDVTESATQALEMLINKYDMLFVDIGLPDIAGFELIRQIRKNKNIASDLPIVVLTGYSEEQEIKYCLDAGANEVSIKPVSKETLEKILSRY